MPLISHLLEQHTLDLLEVELFELDMHVVLCMQCYPVECPTAGSASNLS